LKLWEKRVDGMSAPLEVVIIQHEVEPAQADACSVVIENDTLRTGYEHDVAIAGWPAAM
jgi:hypothetical protein